MTLHIPAGFGQAVYRWTVEGDAEEMVSTIGVDNVGLGSGQANVEDLATEYTGVFGAGNHLAAFVFRGVRLYTADGAGNLQVYEAQRALAGTESKTPHTNNTSLLLTKRTALAGRRGRGRMYLPMFCVGEGDVTATGFITSSLRDAIQPLMDNWLTSTTGYPKVLFHDVNPENPVPMAPTPITSVILSNRVATQRRRMRR